MSKKSNEHLIHLLKFKEVFLKEETEDSWNNTLPIQRMARIFLIFSDMGVNSNSYGTDSFDYYSHLISELEKPYHYWGVTLNYSEFMNLLKILERIDHLYYLA